MGLEMKAACEKCGVKLEPRAVAFICTFECTFCSSCTSEMEGICPNCGGELVRRPRARAAGAED